MIYLLDHGNHLRITSTVIRDLCAEEATHILIPEKPIFLDLYKTIENLTKIIKPNDVVLCAWSTQHDVKLDSLMSILGSKCYVIVAAGNSHVDIKNFSPAKADNVIAVGSLNKSGGIAAHSNFSDSKELKWAPGTNYEMDNVCLTGTSIAAAVYASLLFKSLQSTISIDHLLDEYKMMIQIPKKA